MPQESVVPQECIGIGGSSPEGLKNDHGVLASAEGKNGIPKTSTRFGCGCGIIKARFDKGFECVGRKYLSPFVAVVACGVSASKDMGE